MSTISAAGQVLNRTAELLREPVRRHTVERDDTPASVAKRYGVTEQALLDANPGLRTDDLLYPGELLVVPDVVDDAADALENVANRARNFQVSNHIRSNEDELAAAQAIAQMYAGTEYMRQADEFPAVWQAQFAAQQASKLDSTEGLTPEQFRDALARRAAAREREQNQQGPVDSV